MAIINDNEDKDISFVPSTIIDHRVMKTSHHKIYKIKDQNRK